MKVFTLQIQESFSAYRKIFVREKTIAIYNRNDTQTAYQNVDWLPGERKQKMNTYPLNDKKIIDCLQLFPHLL